MVLVNTRLEKPLWGRFPAEVGELAKRERAYRLTAGMVMPSTALTDRFYATSLAKVQHPEKFPLPTDEEIELARSFVESAAARQAGEDEMFLEQALELIDCTWPAYEEKLRSPEIGAAFMDWLNSSGAKFSFFLYRFYTEVDGFLNKELMQKLHPDTTLQMDTAFGVYLNGKGEPAEIPTTDAAMWHCVNSALWRDVLFRSPLAAYYMRQAGENALVVDLCCGAFNIERRFGYLDAGLNQRVVGYDSNPNVKKWLPRFFAGGAEQYGLEFHQDDYTVAFEDPDLIGKVDFLLMVGALSYHRAQFPETLAGIRKLLKKSVVGKTPKRALVNVEVFTKDLYHSLKVCGLENQSETMRPYMSVEEAVGDVKAHVAAVRGLEIERYFIDNEVFAPEIAPTTVVFLLKSV